MSFEESLRQIVNRYGLTLVLTFGSYNTDRFTDKSDLDIGYVPQITLHSNQQLALMRDFIRLFERDGIDLVDLSRANPLLLYEVARNSQILYEEDNSYLNFKMKASARYADTRFLREQRREHLNYLFKETRR